MGITNFSIYFNNSDSVYFPGQVVSGKVILNFDKPKTIRGIEVKIKGRAKCKWEKQESHTVNRKTEYSTVKRVGEEKYFKSNITLIGGKGEFELPIGKHSYDFALLLPNNIPSSFNGEYGGIQYYVKVKIDVPWATDEHKKVFFEVKNLLNLNDYPNLKTPFETEKNKTFCCLCCASGPLTIVVYVPQIGYTKDQQIPITVEIDNASNVEINSVYAYLIKEIEWKAVGDFKRNRTKIKTFYFGAVNARLSKTWTECMSFPADNFPNIQNCNVIKMKYELQIEADAKGMHSDLDIFIPITVGDIAFNESEPMLPNTIPGAMNIDQFSHPTVGFNYQINPQSMPVPFPGSNIEMNNSNAVPVGMYPPSVQQFSSNTQDMNAYDFLLPSAPSAPPLG